MRATRSFFSCLLLASALALSGCSKDPVTKDLQAYAAVAKLVINPAEVEPMESRLRSARSPGELVAVMNTYADMLDRQVAVLRSYQPKTPEVTKLTGDLHAGMSQMAQAARDFEGLADMVKLAQANQDRELAVKVLGRTRILMSKVDAGRGVMKTALKDLDELAAKKGVKMPQ